MVDKGAAFLSMVSCGCCTVCLAIFFGCFFGIYFPYLRTFNPSSCVILDSFELYSSLYYDGEPHSKYRQHKVSLDIRGKQYIGFGCEATSFHDSTVEYDSPWGFYAYDYLDCSSWNNSTTPCKTSQEIQGRWLCDQYRSESLYKIGETYDCKWHLNEWFKEPWEADRIYEDHPHTEVSYVEVIFQSEPWYPEGEYLTLWILCFGICTCIPLSFLIFIGLPGMWDFWIYKQILRGFRFLYRMVRKLFIFLYRFFRIYICVCWSYYDPYIVVENRSALFLHACAKSKNIHLKKSQSRVIFSYLDNHNY